VEFFSFRRGPELLTTKKTLPILLTIELVMVALLVIATIYVLILQNQAHERLDRAIQLRQATFQVADQLRQSSDDLTRMVRTYAATGDPRFKDYYQRVLDIRTGKAPRPDNYDRIFWDFVISDRSDISRLGGQKRALQHLIAATNASPAELALLTEAERLSNELVDLELEAMQAVQGRFRDEQGTFTRRGEPDQQLALAILYGDDYHRTKKRIMAPINRFLDVIDQRTLKALKSAEGHIVELTVVATTLYALLVLFVPVLVITLIRQQKQSEQTLRTNKQKLRQLANSMPQLVWAADADGRIDYFNERRHEFIGFTQKPDGVWNWSPQIHPDDTEKTLVAWLNAYRKGIPYEIEHRVQRADGGYAWFLSRAQPIRDAAGQIQRWYGTSTDIDNLKQTEQALLEAKKTAEAACRVKSDFLAQISHEIRTPMTVVLTAVEHLLDIETDQMHTDILNLADISSKRLHKLVEELLDFSKIENNKLELESVTFDLRHCLNNAMTMMQPHAAQKNIACHLEIDPDVPKTVVGDDYRLGQILLNLVGNAIKFTESGIVKVTAKCKGDKLVFQVSDTGIGIPKDKRKSIFEVFTQVDSSSTRRYNGAGLGLTISKGLVELMNGRISVESQLGKGSIFTFNIPLHKSRPPTHRQPQMQLQLQQLQPTANLPESPEASC